MRTLKDNLEAQRMDLLSTVQAAKLLAISESSIKRLADAGQLEAVREGKTARKFSLHELSRYLRGRAPGRKTFSEALRTGQGDECVIQFIERHLAGIPLPRSFDELVMPSLGAGADFSVLDRAQPLAELTGNGRTRGETAAIVLELPPADGCGAMLGCLLRAAAFSVLTPPPSIAARDLLAMIHRSRPAVVALAVRGHAEVESLRPLVEAQRFSGGSVIVRADSIDRDSTVPVQHVRSMEEFARAAGIWPQAVESLEAHALISLDPHTDQSQRESARFLTASSTSVMLRSAR